MARLRLLHVERFARNRGIGDALVRPFIAFARSCGYRRIVLWTHTILEAARRLYARNGFACFATAPHVMFGVPLQGEDRARDPGRGSGLTGPGMISRSCAAPRSPACCAHNRRAAYRRPSCWL
ncbi:GNAT family N-acetyltransferase [Swaminathania salitolerans]|uniref:GNAT family N-acetyltransferase n=1 Tax=Swaminathania salitolerans TaxID=182838 RepID=UPI001FE71FDB|nr:GNAT family N-acetyltransferase [Swaminathania salitolerans]